MKKNLYIVLLAGGSGTRFWPLSRHEEPKQFLKIIGGRSLLQETLSRVKSLVLPQNVLVVTNRLYQRKVKEQLKDFGILSKNILLEPEGKNTAPAICWAATKIHRMNPETIMVILPSDHLIVRR
ncbi:MAG TPA: sugar phosphate nucleotidyltransferase, partial [Candidatus Omnitrophota bacterium]|nr:sugar phosphate nucleotidyltransferase [Candidatus Omnitrophota bacterium]